MTFRERLLTTLSGGRPDVLPWFADLTYWYHARKLAGDLPEQYEGDEGFVKLHADHKVGYYLGYASVADISYDNVQATSESDGHTTTTRWQTPVGEIWGQTRFLPVTFSAAPIKWAVQSPEDLRVLRYIADATRVTPNFAGYERQQEISGDQGHPTVLPVRSPISQMLAQWTGATNLTFLVADAPDDIALTVETLGNAADGIYEAACACDTPFVELPDNLSGEVVTPFFKRYQFDYYVRRIEQLHAAGKKVGTHLDGTVHGIMPLLVKSGLDFIEAITPKPTGDISIEELRDYAGPDIILFGGMPGAMFAPPFTRDDVRRHVELIVEHHWDYGKFILGAADQVPPNADMGLLPMIGELCEELCS